MRVLQRVRSEYMCSLLSITAIFKDQYVLNACVLHFLLFSVTNTLPYPNSLTRQNGDLAGPSMQSK